MIRGGRRRGIGAGVESRVDLDLNPRVGADQVPLALLSATARLLNV
jgi:hypothetical protein